jgi:hypothetical protein
LNQAPLPKLFHKRLNPTLHNLPFAFIKGELIKTLQKQVKEWEDWKASSKDRHAKGKAKADQAISKNKQKLGFMKKHKPKK